MERGTRAVARPGAHGFEYIRRDLNVSNKSKLPRPSAGAAAGR
jgi:hypothetical protein